MSTELGTKNLFYAYLLEHGYPDGSIVMDYRIDNSTIVDMVIIDKTTGVPIIAIEFRNGIITDRNREVKIVHSNFLRVTKKLNDIALRGFVVFAKEELPYFDVFEINLDVGCIIGNGIENFKSLRYNSLKNTGLSLNANKAQENRKDALNKINRYSKLFAVGLFLIFITKLIVGFELDIIDLSILGAIIVLILLPYASKVNFFGIEFERYNEARDKE